MNQNAYSRTTTLNKSCNIISKGNFHYNILMWLSAKINFTSSYKED